MISTLSLLPIDSQRDILIKFLFNKNIDIKDLYFPYIDYDEAIRRDDIVSLFITHPVYGIPVISTKPYNTGLEVALQYNWRLIKIFMLYGAKIEEVLKVPDGIFFADKYFENIYITSDWLKSIVYDNNIPLLDYLFSINGLSIEKILDSASNYCIETKDYTLIDYIYSMYIDKSDLSPLYKIIGNYKDKELYNHILYIIDN